VKPVYIGQVWWHVKSLSLYKWPTYGKHFTQSKLNCIETGGQVRKWVHKPVKE